MVARSHENGGETALVVISVVTKVTICLYVYGCRLNALCTIFSAASESSQR